MTFTEAQQREHRKTFIHECRQKAWSAACHAEWIAKTLDDLMARFQKLQEEDRTLDADIKAAEVAPDYHTVENRNRRKAMQERRNQLAQEVKVIGENVQRGQQSVTQLYQSVESNLALAEHAEKWEWKEAGTKPAEYKPRSSGYILQKDWADRKAGEILKADQIGDAAIYKDLIAQGVIVEDE